MDNKKVYIHNADGTISQKEIQVIEETEDLKVHLHDVDISEDEMLITIRLTGKSRVVYEPNK